MSNNENNKFIVLQILCCVVIGFSCFVLGVMFQHNRQQEKEMQKLEDTREFRVWEKYTGNPNKLTVEEWLEVKPYIYKDFENKDK